MAPSKSSFALRTLLLFLLLAVSPRFSLAQVSPSEISDAQLKSLETEYLQKLIALNRQISSQKFPFPFLLTRYVGVEPKDQTVTDSRGLEFVKFHEHTLLKFSGNYRAAFSAPHFTQNQRASQVFTDVVVPVLKLLPQYFSANAEFDSVGFEISYHVTDSSGKAASYEGKENLVLVLSAADAFRFPQLADTDARQAVLTASEVYVSGERLGLALGQIDPLPIDAMAGASPAQRAQSSIDPAGRSFSADSGQSAPDFHASATVNDHPAAPPVQHPRSMVDAPPLSPADVDALQAKYQSALDDYAIFVQSSAHQSGSVSPSLVLFRNFLFLQLTLRNPETFDRDKTSLYKRTALSFDTFLAPHLGDLVSRLPSISNLQGLDITVLVFSSSNSSSSEAVEFLCPLPALRSFASYDISNQDLINQSMVIVNGVRISLNLQQVE